ncbi:hypothetical protein [Desulfosporosinus sp.]|uniref:hypothetical protein n=1 Tax=Desulfosporosinus sp. TaxID=157907 RepID=UPI0025C29154|nr:hypothetical protein [Desulfosporosinus sp.]MBC2723676.1 hypothetical protein [Desulfosporosinus sp.]MBC2726524.1 hypothetical protein [Desulfosporosinus sp.]
MGIATLAFVIAKIPINWKRIFLVGTILALSAYIVRLFPIPFGVHTFVLMFMMSIFLIKLCRAEFSISIIASLVSYVTLVLFEIICLSLLMPVLGVTPEILLKDSVVRILISIPQELLLFCSAFFLRYFYLKRGSYDEFYSN